MTLECGTLREWVADEMGSINDYLIIAYFTNDLVS